MTADNPPPENGPGTTGVPPYADIFAGPVRVETRVANMAAVRNKISPRELGVLAGRGVYDQFFHAKGETSENLLTDPNLSVAQLYSLLGMLLPLAALTAAVAVDYEIFGSAAKDMEKTNHLFNAFAIGSVIFAGGMAIVKEQKKTMIALMIGASLGASFIAADNSKFRERFANPIANAFTTGNDGPKAVVNDLQKQIAKWEADKKANELRLDTGGNKGLSLRGDGSGPNDVTADRLEAANIELQDKIDKATPQLSKAETNLDIATRKDWVQLLARLLAAGYIGAWLMASQFVVAKVLEMAAENFAKQREKSVARNKFKMMVRGIENVNAKKGRAKVRAAVSNMLTNFAEILATSPTGSDPEKHDRFAAMFEDDPFDKMTEIGVRHVYDMIVPKQTFGEKVAGFFNKHSQRTSGKKAALEDEGGQAAEASPPRSPQP